MALIPNSISDILKSKTMRGLPTPVEYPKADILTYTQGADNFHKVMAIKPGDHVVMLYDPLIDPRVLQAVNGVAGNSGVGTIQSGSIEESNVDTTSALVDMIKAQRDFQANAQMIQTDDQITQTIIGIHQ